VASETDFSLTFKDSQNSERLYQKLIRAETILTSSINVATLFRRYHGNYMGNEVRELDSYIDQLQNHKRTIERLSKKCRSTLKIVSLHQTRIKSRISLIITSCHSSLRFWNTEISRRSSRPTMRYIRTEELLRN
jgi:hypothetical protein